MRRSSMVAAIAMMGMVARAQEAIPVTTVAAIKDASVFLRTSVESEVDGNAMTGSGFLIRSEGTTAYVVTNAHVVTPPRDRQLFSGWPTTKAIFRSGTKNEASATAEVVATDQPRDLAILRVTGVARLPRPIDLVAEAEPFETMTVYIFGFPFGEKLTFGKGNPPVNVGRGQVSSIRRNEDERLKSILLDGTLNPGNSGGPVVDVKGKLVGVARATIRGANIGFAIAVPELIAMLQGSAEGSNVTVKTIKDAEVELRFEAALIDPLDRVKSARLLYTTETPTFSKTARPKPARDPVDDAPAEAPGRHDGAEPEDSIYGPIETAKSIAMVSGNQRAEGILMIPKPKESLSIWSQVVLVDGEGKTTHAKPIHHLLGPSNRGENSRLTAWGEVIDPDGDCALKMENGEMIGDVPGTLHDLNVDIGVNNAPRVVREIEGDFVARVKVAGSFRPGTDRTGPKSVPSNCAGLVVWLDSGNYLRMERGSMNRNNRVVGFLNFEAREHGSKSEGHNKGGLDPKKDLWLQLVRKGETISGSYSDDGRDWVELEPMNLVWPRKLKVGLDLINSCGDPMSVRFSDYSLSKSNS